MKEVADAIMALAYKTTDVLSAISSSTLPDSACQCIDSLLNLYLIRTRVSHLHDDDFYWILNMINKSNSSVKLSFLHNYLLRILTINSDEILLPNTNVLKLFNNHVSVAELTWMLACQQFLLEFFFSIGQKLESFSPFNQSNIQNA